MFNTTLRYLNLIILPHPSFDVPLSEPDPVFKIHGKKGDNDTSYISQNQVLQLGPIEVSTLRKPVLNANERRRNTICCYSCHCIADPFPANEDIPLWPVNISLNSLSSDTSRYNPSKGNVHTPSISTRVKIVTPHDPPSPSLPQSGQPWITSFVNFSDSSDDRVTPKKVKSKIKNRCSPNKGKEKRHSAPPAVSLHKEQFGIQNSGAIGIASTNQSSQSPDRSQPLPTLLRKDQRQKPHANSNSPYTSKHFEIGLSPIIEDTHTLANTLRGPKRVEMEPAIIDTLDSSGSSYGELIQNKPIDYLSMPECEIFGGLEWKNQERNKQPEYSAHFVTQNYPDLRGDRYWGDEFWETFQDSSLIPELMLTAPTPEMGISVKFRSQDQTSEPSYDDDCLEYQRPEANSETAKACRPSQLGYTTAPASISESLRSGADMLLGVGNGVFDDMVDTGVICRSTPGLPVLVAAHAADHLGDDWPGPLAAQSLGNSQAKTGFLGHLLRQKSTERSKISERKSRVLERVSRILQSSWRSSRSVRDQERSTATALAGPLEESHAANGPLNASRGWKRFSRILANATVSSRRRSAGDQAQFTESADPLEGGHSGFSDSGNTRRHGLDIPSDSAEHVGERWYGSPSPGTAMRAYINEKHATYLDKPIDAGKNIGTSKNWYGSLFRVHVTKSLDHEPRRHSFGPSTKRHWRYSAEGPGSSCSTNSRRVRNRLKRHSTMC